MRPRKTNKKYRSAVLEVLSELTQTRPDAKAIAWYISVLFVAWEPFPKEVLA